MKPHNIGTVEINYYRIVEKEYVGHKICGSEMKTSKLILTNLSQQKSGGISNLDCNFIILESKRITHAIHLTIYRSYLKPRNTSINYSIVHKLGNQITILDPKSNFVT